MIKNKTIKVISICFLVLMFSSFTTPNKAAKQIVKLINSGKVKKITRMYLTVEEFEKLVTTIEPPPTEAEIAEFKKSLEGGKMEYISLLTESIEAKKFNKVLLDSVTYKYKIAKHGRDENINWPNSLHHIPSNTLFTGMFLKMYLTDQEKKYVINVSMIYTAKGFRFLLLRKRPEIIELK